MTSKKISELVDKSIPADVDVLPIVDTVAVETKKVSWLNIKATLKTYFDTLYATIAHTHTGVYEPANSNIQTHISSTSNPHTVTKTQVGLGNVDNTSDANKPVSSAQQSALDLKINATEKAASNGVATLDGGGKVPASQLPNTVMEYKGTWNATTNSPALADGTGNAGDVYLVGVAGTQNLGSGAIVFNVGDWVVCNGTIWEQSLNSDKVVSVNGYQGVVVLSKNDVGLGNVPNLDTTNAVANQHTHSNKSILDLVTEAFTTALKSAYDSASSWVVTNGANVLAGTANNTVTITGASYSPAQDAGQLNIMCDATAQPITINLPGAISNKCVFNIKKTDASANAITIDGNASQTIDGDLTKTIAYKNTSLQLVASGSNWNIV